MAENSIDAIRERLAAATPGPWHWFGNTKSYQLGLGYWRKGWGRCSVMLFNRWGMRSAQPYFQNEEVAMEPASSFAVWEVDRTATDPNSRTLYRHDVVGIRHPDAVLIASAPTDIAYLLSRVDAVLSLHRESGGCNDCSRSCEWQTADGCEPPKRCTECKQEWPCATIRAVTANE